MTRGLALRAALACAAAATCVVIPRALGAPAARSPATAVSECVSFEQSGYEHGLVLRLRSECERDLACTLRWSLRCEGARERSEGAAFDLAPQSAKSVRASAGACGKRGWEISDVTWQCRTR